VLVTAASGGSSLFAQYRPFAILKPKNKKKRMLNASRRERIIFVCICICICILEFTAQKGSAPEYRHSALLHTNPKRIKESKAKQISRINLKHMAAVKEKSLCLR
jgi:hypothetical protein